MAGLPILGLARRGFYEIPKTATRGSLPVHKWLFYSFPQLGSPQQKPKRLRLVVDVSGSMYRFNRMDGRLERTMEAVCMVMEAFENYEEKFKVMT